LEKGPARLAYLVSQYPAFNHTFILREIRALRSLGFEIEVVSIRPPDRLVERLDAEERDELRYVFTVLTAGPARAIGAHLRSLSRAPGRYLAALLEAVRLGRGDPKKTVYNLAYFAEAVVAGDYLLRLGIRHAHSHFTSTVALLLARAFPVTYSVTFHGPDEFNDVVGFYVKEKVARARFVIAISWYARSQIMKAARARDWEKVEVARLGVDCGVFAPSPRVRESKPFEILCVGRLAPAKAQQVLIGAIDRIVRGGREAIHLRLVGEGPDRPAIERLIAARGLGRQVTLEGACNQARVRSFYRETDLFALASFAEGVPVVLMEAMAMEIPCVATWITGIPELMRDGVDGCLVAPGDEEQLAGAIVRLMEDPELRRRLGESARARVREDYDLEKNVRRLAAIYQRRLSMKES
jgi:glycosyltransferase involved in cell wall biosynthesis